MQFCKFSNRSNKYTVFGMWNKSAAPKCFLAPDNALQVFDTAQG